MWLRNNIYQDFGAHTNYIELALRELGFQGVFPHTGCSTEININGRYIFPLVTGTFGAVDFLHSVIFRKIAIVTLDTDHSRFLEKQMTTSLKQRLMKWISH